ncbi:MAG: hypothetical protein ACI3XX_02495 [Eubacteriales bacterium]
MFIIKLTFSNLKKKDDIARHSSTCYAGAPSAGSLFGGSKPPPYVKRLKIRLPCIGVPRSEE